jgi:hypothetical protein
LGDITGMIILLPQKLQITTDALFSVVISAGLVINRPIDPDDNSGDGFLK